jgi:hypothetical protein
LATSDRPTGSRSSEPKQLRGNTLRVYLYVLKNGPCELREVQRGLAFSTASLASYHLGKLIESGYVHQDQNGKYATLRDVSTQVLEGYTKVGVAIVPQFFFLALLFSILVGFFSYAVVFVSMAYIPFLVGVALASVVLLWVETIRLWRRLVTWR